MLKWVIGIAVAMTAIALVARVLQLGISLALLGVAAVAGVIALVLGLMTWMQRRDSSDRG
ncbi:hypothetical protein [Falsiroseomonas tokyonensis]|uniref:Uncharacterized protein n=1 Tax=Falsiroseomonas tokyonensis TaxID=430521 RepID=A0ABV7BTY5_9PROT|nr:hypothetical protein [Falsiroseomonas tokyonensis]MBU8537621.1 hypothetical protein [Falsiroseomonas tokyonensis]